MAKSDKTYQKPSADHPWRQYKNRVKDIEGVEVEFEIKIISVKEYLTKLLENWDDVKVSFQTPFEGASKHKLTNLPQYKVAAWLAGTLKRNYVQKRKRPE